MLGTLHFGIIMSLHIKHYGYLLLDLSSLSPTKVAYILILFLLLCLVLCCGYEFVML